MAEVTLFGLGPVGLATAWELLRCGHTVIGHDTNSSLLEKHSKGAFPRATEIAADLSTYLGRNFFLKASLAAKEISERVVVCVGTPTGEEGFDLDGLLAAVKAARPEKGSGISRHFVIRSTLLPGTIESVVIPYLGGGEVFELSYFPEFLREKYLREDCMSPPLRVACHSSAAARASFLELFPGSYGEPSSFSSAEALKLACNAFHALKVVFANEVASFCEAGGASVEEVMGFLCQDKKLNISDAYLKPGGAFAGPCLDKDLTAVESVLDKSGSEAPLLRAIRQSNFNHARRFEKKKLIHV